MKFAEIKQKINEIDAELKTSESRERDCVSANCFELAIKEIDFQSSLRKEKERLEMLRDDALRALDILVPKITIQNNPVGYWFLDVSSNTIDFKEDELKLLNRVLFCGNKKES